MLHSFEAHSSHVWARPRSLGSRSCSMNVTVKTAKNHRARAGQPWPTEHRRCPRNRALQIIAIRHHACLQYLEPYPPRASTREVVCLGLQFLLESLRNERAAASDIMMTSCKRSDLRLLSSNPAQARSRLRSAFRKPEARSCLLHFARTCHALQCPPAAQDQPKLTCHCGVHWKQRAMQSREITDVAFSASRLKLDRPAIMAHGLLQRPKP